MAFRTCGSTSAVAGVKWRRYVNHVRGASSHHYSFPSAQWKIENRWLVASHLTILVLDVIHRGVILMACVFCRPEDLCNPRPQDHCRQSCIGPPAPKNGAIRMTKRNGTPQFLSRSNDRDNRCAQQNPTRTSRPPDQQLVNIQRSLSLNLCTFPVAVFGNSSRNSTQRGRL